MHNENKISKIYSLTPLQEGILFHSILDENSHAYFEQAVFEIEGILDVNMFEKSFNLLIKKHDIFRTIFIYDKINKPQQVVLNDRNAKVKFNDISEMQDNDIDKYIREILLEEKKKGFNLSQDILFRIVILKTGKNNFKIVLSYHHIVIDGWSLAVIVKDLFLYYLSFKYNKKIVEDSTVPYNTYIEWLQKQDTKNGYEYWKKYLSGYKNVNVQNTRLQNNEYSNRTKNFKLDKSLTDSLVEISKNHNITLSIIVHLIWGLVLQKIRNVTDIVFGSIVSGRPAEINGIESIVGLLINIVPVRINCTNPDSFLNTVRHFQKKWMEAEKYHHLSLADVIAYCQKKIDIIENIVAYENFPITDSINEERINAELGFRVSNTKHSFGQTNYNLNVIFRHKEELRIEIKYNGRIFSDGYIDRLGYGFDKITKEIVSNPDINIRDLDIIDINTMLLEDRNYWLKVLDGNIEKSIIPYDDNSKVNSKERLKIKFAIEDDITQKILKISNNSYQRAYMILLAAVKILIYRYSGNPDIICGAPIYKQDTKGQLNNTVLALRDVLSEQMAVSQLLLNIRQTVDEANKHSNYPIDRICHQFGLSYEHNNIPLFDIIVLLKNIHEKSYIEQYEANMIFLFFILENKISCEIEYNSSAYRKDSIKRIISHLEQILKGFILKLNILIGDIEMLFPHERQQLLEDFNNTKTDLIQKKTLSQLFEEQVEKFPDKPAVSLLINHADTMEVTDIINDLSAYNKFARIDFIRNSYIYIYPENTVEEYFNEELKEFEKGLRLIKTNKQNSVLVNKAVFNLLNRFNSKLNVNTILKDKSILEEKYLILELGPLVNGNITILNKTEAVLTNENRNIALIVKALYKSNLIKFFGKEDSINYKQVPAEKSNTTNNEKSKIIFNKDLHYKPSGKPVLLLGDTTGSATVGLLYLASYLRRNNVEAYCQWNDFNTDSILLKNNIENLIKKINPEIIGISLKWFPHISRVLYICKLIKKVSSDIKIVLGGNTAAYYSDKLIKDENIDYIVLGDGELPLLKICTGEEEIPNCIYKKDGAIVKAPITYVQDENNSDQIYLSHLNDIFTEKQDPFYSQAFYIYTGKGCSQSCFYCAGCQKTQKLLFNRSRSYLRNKEEIINDMVVAKDITSTFLFDFEIPGVDHYSFFADIWDSIDLSNHFCSFYSWTTPSDEFLDLLSRTFKYVFLSIDLCSLSERHRLHLTELKLVKPQPKDTEIFTTLEKCEKFNNLEVNITMIAGLPYFTEEDINENERMIKYLKKTYRCLSEIIWGRLHAQPGAPIVENYLKYDMHSIADSYDDFLDVSKKNMAEKVYPDLEGMYYPYIYYNDDQLNSLTTRHYLKVAEILNDKRCSKYEYTLDSVTYKELNEKSNKVACALRKEGIKANSIVGIMTDRQIEKVTAVIGVLKAGGAYLPISEDLPEERIQYMLKDSNAQLLLTDHNMAGHQDINIKKKYLNNFDSDCSEEVNADNINSLSDLAYIIYTSGTTGEPKGVMVEHKSISNNIQWRKSEYKLSSESRVLQLFSFAFDGFLTSFFTPLISGSHVFFLQNNEAKDPLAIKKCIREHSINHFICVPSLYNAIIHNMDKTDMKTLQYITFAGEKSWPDLVNMSKELNPDLELINEYGPTESSVVSTVHRNMSDPAVIGRPVWNTKIYILNKLNKLSPLNVPGELCISGTGLAKGYLNKPDLTKEKFVENPFESGKRMYRTGDHAKWRENGNIEFLGRIDNQVKIRGFRVETGEVETQILKNKKIKEAAVLVRGDNGNNKYLYAYYVPETEITNTELREYLSGVLPAYMIPAFFVKIEKLPLNKSGKVDKKALYDIKVKIESEEEYEAPRDEIEEKLVKIWREVLGIERISINDNFFNLGGHSLKATLLISKLHKFLNIEIPLREIFNLPTIKSLADYIKNSINDDFSRITTVPQSSSYPVSSAQKRLFQIDMLLSNNENKLFKTAYNAPGAFIFEGKLNVAELEEIIKKIITRQDSLRTHFDIKDGEVVQIIDKETNFKITIIESRGDVEQEIESFIRPFELTNAPLFRIGIIKINTNRNIFLFDSHHIIADGFSIDILLKEIMSLYNKENLEKLSVQYKDFALWNNRILKSERMQKKETYWIDQFKNDIPVLNMPYDYIRPELQSFEGDTVSVIIEKTLTDNLKNLILDKNVTLYMLLLAAYYILISKYSNQEDIIVGTWMSGRSHADLHNIIGMFVNTLALRNYPDGNKIFIEFLSEVKENTLGALENQEYPFEELITKIDLKRDIGRNPLFDAAFLLQNISLRELELGNLKISPYEIKRKVAKFDLTLFAMEMKDSIRFDFEYCTKLFKKETIERLSVHFINIINEIAANPELKIRDIKMISETERNELIYNFNSNSTDYPKNKSIVSLFEEQVRMTPDNIAVTDKNEKLSYLELNKRTNKLAGLLLSKGVKKDDIVGLMIERSVNMMIGIIAILKAGGAYLPIDMEYPVERIRYMLADCDTKILISNTSIEKNDFGKYIDVVNINAKEISEYNDLNPDKITGPDNLAYIMYTSGSTGEPKGVMVEHRNVIRLVKNTNYISIKETDKFLQTGAPMFDATTFEHWGCLLNGGSLHLVDNEILLNIDNLKNYLLKNEITVLWLTSPLFNQLIEQDECIFDKLKYLLVGGDVVSPKHINRLRQINPKLNIINGYGPTENTTFSLCHRIENDYSKSIPIGRPISNSTAYILDKYMNPVPAGVAGELYVGGDGVARGYLKKPELTQKYFLKDVFRDNGKMYKTGDLAKWLPDGIVEFIGRKDFQIKIRGFRIEPGEIEIILGRYPGIKSAVVVYRKNEGKDGILYAYFVSDEKIEISLIKKFLAKELPNYMIPKFIIQIEKFPLTKTGKIDRNSLPKPGKNNADTNKSYKAPTNEIEKKLVKIWQDVLKVSIVGIDDNFFEIGGNSLAAMALIHNIKKEFNVDLPMPYLYKTDSLRKLAYDIENIDTILNNLFDEPNFLLLNKKCNNNIFAFPPMPGYAVCYSILADCINSHSFYSFDYIEADDRLDQYIKMLTRLNHKDKPFIIFGFSFGGNFAFEITKKLISSGYKVTDLIIMDSMRFSEEIEKPGDEFYENLDPLENRLSEFFNAYHNYNNDFNTDFVNNKDVIQQTADRYLSMCQYARTLINSGMLDTKIHLIVSTDNDDKGFMGWDAVTSQNVDYYHGEGIHLEMIYKESNGKILSDILKNLTDY